MNEIKFLENEFRDYNIKLRPINEDIYNKLETLHNRELVKKIFSSRFKDFEEFKLWSETKLSDLLTKEFISKLTDVEKASKIIKDAVVNKKRILQFIDYDVDGITSGVVGYKMFTKLFEHDNIEVVVNKREYGNGLNDTMLYKLIKMHKENPFDVLITSDHGSHDRNNLEALKKELDIKIIVTDHHLFDNETSPLGIVEAFINPQRDNDPYLKQITGTHVLFYTLLYAYLDLIKEYPEYEFPKPELNLNTETKENYIYYLINYIGLTIVSDVMSLRNYINRKFLTKALKNINSKLIEQDTFWSVVKERVASTYFVDEVTFGFDIVPVLNSPGRVDNPRLSFEFMIEEDPEKSKMFYEEILSVNDRRKDKQVKSLNRDDNIELKSEDLIVMLIKNSEGIQGNIANNVLTMENYTAAICFTEHRVGDEKILIGSGRLKGDLNLKDIMDRVNEKCDLLISYGGHKGAIGIKIKDDLETFFKLVDEELKNDLKKLKEVKKDKEEILVDDFVFSNKRLFTSVFDMKTAGPFGLDFERPLFASKVKMHSFRVFKKNGKTFLNAKVKMSELSAYLVNLFYTFTKQDYEDNLLEKLKYCKDMILVYTISVNTYMSTNKILLNVEKIILL